MNDECCSPAAQAVLDDEGLARVAKALGHPARVRILRLLIERQACVVGSLVDELPLAQSTVSQHLKVLKEAGLVQGTVEGPSVCYCANPGTLSALGEALSFLLAAAREAPATSCNVPGGA